MSSTRPIDASTIAQILRDEQELKLQWRDQRDRAQEAAAAQLQQYFSIASYRQVMPKRGSVAATTHLLSEQFRPVDLSERKLTLADHFVTTAIGTTNTTASMTYGLSKTTYVYKPRTNQMMMVTVHKKPQTLDDFIALHKAVESKNYYGENRFISKSYYGEYRLIYVPGHHDLAALKAGELAVLAKRKEEEGLAEPQTCHFDNVATSERSFNDNNTFCQSLQQSYKLDCDDLETDFARLYDFFPAKPTEEENAKFKADFEENLASDIAKHTLNTAYTYQSLNDDNRLIYTSHPPQTADDFYELAFAIAIGSTYKADFEFTFANDAQRANEMAEWAYHLFCDAEAAGLAFVQIYKQFSNDEIVLLARHRPETPDDFYTLALTIKQGGSHFKGQPFMLCYKGYDLLPEQCNALIYNLFSDAAKAGHLLAKHELIEATIAGNKEARKHIVLKEYIGRDGLAINLPRKFKTADDMQKLGVDLMMQAKRTPCADGEALVGAYFEMKNGKAALELSDVLLGIAKQLRDEQASNINQSARARSQAALFATPTTMVAMTPYVNEAGNEIGAIVIDDAYESCNPSPISVLSTATTQATSPTPDDDVAPSEVCRSGVGVR